MVTLDYRADLFIVGLLVVMAILLNWAIMVIYCRIRRD